MQIVESCPFRKNQKIISLNCSSWVLFYLSNYVYLMGWLCFRQNYGLNETKLLIKKSKNGCRSLFYEKCICWNIRLFVKVSFFSEWSTHLRHNVGKVESLVHGSLNKRGFVLQNKTLYKADKTNLLTKQTMVYLNGNK